MDNETDNASVDTKKPELDPTAIKIGIRRLLSLLNRSKAYFQHNNQSFVLLLRHDCTQSMSREGNPYENAVMESFFRTLKRELVQDANYDNPEQVRMEIFKYIETYYNTKRIHSAQGYLFPTELESQKS